MEAVQLTQWWKELEERPMERTMRCFICKAAATEENPVTFIDNDYQCRECTDELVAIDRELAAEDE